MRWVVALLVFATMSGCLSDEEPEGDGHDVPAMVPPSHNVTNVTDAANVTLNVTVPEPAPMMFQTVDGTLLNFTIAEPEVATTPRTLVLAAHGIGHDIDSWRNHTAEMATWGVTAAAINYRDNYGFPILWGAQDLIAARAFLHETYGPFDRTVLVSVSMGTAVGGTALAESDGLFDVWFSAEGLSLVYESWAEACAAGAGIEFAAEVCTFIEIDAGRGDDGSEGSPCTPAECPDAYIRRSPARRTAEMTEITQVFVIHPAMDGLVPYDQGRQLADALTEVGIPTQFTTVLRGEEGTDQDTTATSHAFGRESDVDKAHGLAGHNSENDRASAVVATLMEQLQAFLADGSVLHGDVVDRR